MLFQKKILDGIQDGSVTLAFRRWRRPTVRSGGTLLTPIGELRIGSVAQISLDSISEVDAKHAGFSSQEALLAELTRRPEGDVYRIELGPLHPDPRIALREIPAKGKVLEELRDRLRRLDARAAGGAWTIRVLEVLRAHPGVRAGDLCAMVGQEKEPFKRNVRKLKNLGLTESLGTGYRLSPRGLALLEDLRQEGDQGNP